MIRRAATANGVARLRHRALRVDGSRTLALILLLALVPAAVVSANTSAVSQMGGTSQSPGGTRFNRDDPLRVDDDTLDIERPADWGVYAYYDVYENSFHDNGDPRDTRAVNVNTLGEVPDSNWFENRLGVREMSIDELIAGSNLTGGPADGRWTVVGRPTGGVTPKFIIEDTEGQRFILKFDPVENPEIASTAEMVSSRLYYAFGFHVAEAYLVTLTKDRLVIGEGATFTNEVGKRSLIDQIDIDHWVSNSPVLSDGTYRALASKFVPGEAVGEFRFFGTRPDDPNDIFDHENRRELRGYRVIAAWTNHDDSRALNTYDSYTEEDGRRFIKHYVLDFGSTLGSASIGANLPRGGNEYFLEGGATWKAAVTLGLWSRPWLHAEFPHYPAVGNIEGDYFRPDVWKPEYLNAAFARMDAADGFWAARIVSRFSDEAVRRIVQNAEISDPEAETYLIEVLLRRRDKVVDHWITQTNPLDDFELTGGGDNLTLTWDNAAIRVGAASEGARYGVRWSAFDNRTGGEARLNAREVNEPSAAVPTNAWGTPDAFGYRYLRAHIFTRHPGFPWWEQPVVVTVRNKGAEGIDIVGVERPLEFPEG
jgi:hypothetical protein